MSSQTQKRFRKRGGAKKKKNIKERAEGTEKQPLKPVHRPISTPSRYFSGFTTVQENRLDNDLQSYLGKLQDELETLDPGAEIATDWHPNESEDVPPSVLLARNALRELSSRASEVARDNYAARTVEALLRCAKDSEVLATFLHSILDCGPSSVASMAMHRCASHVLQTSIHVLCQFLDGKNDSAMAKLGATISSWTDEEISDVIQSPSGSHVFRATLAALAGLPEDEPREARLDDSSPSKIRNYIETHGKEVPEDWLQMARSIGMRLLESTSLSITDMLWQPAPCTALQALLSALAVRDKSVAKQIGQRVIESDFDRLIYDSCGSRFLERLILILGYDVVKVQAKGKLAEFALHPKANFCLQRMLLGLKGRGEVMSAWDELESSVPNLLGRGKTREGVVLALLRITEAEGDENCRRRATRTVIRAVGAVGRKTSQLAGFMAFGSEEMWEKWRSVVRDAHREDLGILGKDDDELRVPHHIPSPQLLGTLMARCLMRFPGGPGQSARDSMASLSSLELLALTGNPVGSRLVEQWIGDADIERCSKNAVRLLKAAKEGSDTGILALARNRYGAMILSRCTQHLSVDERKKVMDKLASALEALKAHEFGQVVVRKCRVEQYLRRGIQWEREETGRETRQRLFSEIINDSEDNIVSLKQAKTRKRKREKANDLDASDGVLCDHAIQPLSNSSASNSEGCNRLADNSDQRGSESNSSGLAPVLNAIESLARAQASKRKGGKKKLRKLIP
ncbi:Nucleolar protein [Gracilaria domingensis]|nr:Nucleolar protein [Gracilaria domingensis]